MSPLAVVVVPARDEESRIGACLAALAVQAGVAPGDLQVVVVLDGCTDGTAEAVRAAGCSHPWLAITTIETDGIGPGLARREGMLVARERDPRLLCTTDADTVVARDWVATQLAAVRGGAEAVAGRVELEAVEAAALEPDVLAARATDARQRLAAVRTRAPEAEHGQFSTASVALTCAAHDAVGGLPLRPTGEDDALEQALVGAGVRIAYPRGVRVTTSARPGGRMTRPPAPIAPASLSDAPLVVQAPAGRRGAALRAASATQVAGIVVALPEGTPDPEATAEALAAPLLADERLVLVKGMPRDRHPLDELLARPALELHARALTAITSPMSQAWAIRAQALSGVDLPEGDAADVAVLLEVHRSHGLPAIAEAAVDVPAPVIADAAALSYEVLAAIGGRSMRPAVPGLRQDAHERFSPSPSRGTSTSAW